MTGAERFFQARITSTIKPQPKISAAKGIEMWESSFLRCPNRLRSHFHDAYFSALIRLVGRVVNWFTALVAASEIPSACLEHTL
jgi:hypothetical protein